jgi:uncharacterized protein YwgA
MRESIFKGPAFITHLVKTISEKYPDKQVGKTVIQKLLFLLTREGVVDFDYSMYHYGPYSAQAFIELNFAEDIGAVEVVWVQNRGYFIKPKDTSLERLLDEEEKAVINRIAEKYGTFNATELSIITTALFVRDYFGVVDDEEIVQVVASLKPQYRRDRIGDILKNCGVVQ